MPTNSPIDPELVEQALEPSDECTEAGGIIETPQELIAHRSQKRVLDLLGKLQWDADFDHKRERTRP